MNVSVEACNLRIFKNKREFLTFLLEHRLNESLVYLQEERLFIHRVSWIQLLERGCH
ncbi:hypothetical protein ACX8XN_18505 [Calditrichota bacterium GD2]